jgi:anthranilate phosphoribosyltransferase
VVVHGEPGLDEVSPVSVTQVCIVEDGKVRREEWTPATFGARPIGLESLLSANSSEENGELLIEAVTQLESLRCLAVLPSAAVAIRLADLAPDWKSAYELARETVRSGKSAEKMAKMRVDS